MTPGTVLDLRDVSGLVRDNLRRVAHSMTPNLASIDHIASFVEVHAHRATKKELAGMVAFA
jgi:hypothetical protein